VRPRDKDIRVSPLVSTLFLTYFLSCRAGAVAIHNLMSWPAAPLSVAYRLRLRVRAGNS